MLAGARPAVPGLNRDFRSTPRRFAGGVTRTSRKSGRGERTSSHGSGCAPKVPFSGVVWTGSWKISPAVAHIFQEGFPGSPCAGKPGAAIRIFQELHPGGAWSEDGRRTLVRRRIDGVALLRRRARRRGEGGVRLAAPQKLPPSGRVAAGGAPRPGRRAVGQARAVAHDHVRGEVSRHGGVCFTLASSCRR